MNSFLKTIDGVQEILGICPCCGEIFRLAEAKFVFPKKPLRSSHYLDLLALERELNREDERLSERESEFEEQVEAHRIKLREAGRASAKRKLREIDPHFSGREIDPQCVKLIFHPVEYVIFHGLKSENKVTRIEFLSRIPEYGYQEKITSSIDRAVKAGNLEFETLHMLDDGTFDIRTAVPSTRKRRI